MFKILVLLTLSHEISTLRACTPNTQFIFNGRLCFCNNRGYLIEANCKTISRRQSCQPGQTIWQGCNQCICQENGYLLCSNSRCSDGFVQPPILRQGLSIYGLRCTPYRSYYVNCSVCVCPASGVTNEAQCVKDLSCDPHSSYIDFSDTRKVYCIPNVMYLSPCEHCLCPDHGYFDPGSCVQKCKDITFKSPERHCVPGSFYRIDCNICRCPNSGVPDVSLCVSGTCNNFTLHALRIDSNRCTLHSFTAPRCMYCDCNAEGVVNENACLEIECTKTNQLGKPVSGTSKCHPGEMLPLCIECFCTRNGQTLAKYCSRRCSYQNRLNILDLVLKDASDFDLIERGQIQSVKENERCTPNSLYLDNGRYCLCPESGNPDFNLCTSVTHNVKHLETQDIVTNNVEIDYNSSCEPNTFVEFDCNTCYCAKNGKIDPKWCTYDNCQAKRLIQESHNTDKMTVETVSGTCHPGAISKLKCNYCICPESGILKEKACTQNDCSEIDPTKYNDKLSCEPLAYYEVDCNICYCPRDGIKNVAKCTKNPCEKSGLRSDSCLPGQLFTDDCNLCICPPDGNKIGKTCTNHDCPEVVPRKLPQFSDDLLDNHIIINYTRSLDQCFPGEEFVDGCKLCICTELGLKMYATCESVLCDEIRHIRYESTTKLNKANNTENANSVRSRRNTHDCFIYNVSMSAERKECTPGTVYIIRCKECICPYLGNINNFCRPLSKKVHCEQAFPYFNYLPMGRRTIKEVAKKRQTITEDLVNDTSDIDSRVNTTDFKVKNESYQIKVRHGTHTEFKCEKSGRILDQCFICNCEEGKVVEEHCYKSDAESCADAKPTFLFENKVDL